MNSERLILQRSLFTAFCIQSPGVCRIVVKENFRQNISFIMSTPISDSQAGIGILCREAHRYTPSAIASPITITAVAD